MNSLQQLEGLNVRTFGFRGQVAVQMVEWLVNDFNMPEVGQDQKQ
ncbi:hypothetical protein [Lysinibacillus xylanilyticus]|nr:hypothetical protein [Lysinibacillus xylanilyticus]